MKTFNGDRQLKKELLTKLKHHKDLDTFVQGIWLDEKSGKVKGNGYKGCFYGCTMQTSEKPIEKFSEKYYIDLWYCSLTEKIFEGLPNGEYQKFPYESIKILPVNFDFNKVKSLFHRKVLQDQLRFCKNDERVTKAIEECIELFSVDFDKIDKVAAWSAAWSAESAAKSAKSAARSAKSAAWSAESAAKSAAWSAESAAKSAKSAAWSAESAARSAKSAAWSAKSAAWSAARSAKSAAWLAESVARSAKKDYYVFLRDTLFECIKECK